MTHLLQTRGRRARRLAGSLLATALVPALAASCSNAPRPHVLGKVIERTTTTQAGSDPRSTPGGEVTTTTAPPSSTITTNGAGVVTGTTAKVTTSTTSAPKTATTGAPQQAPATSTTPSTIAGEPLAPGPYLEQSDGSDVVVVGDDGLVSTLLVAPDVIERDVTYRVRFTLQFGQENVGAVPIPVPITGSIENTSGSPISFPDGFKMHLVCQRSGTDWLSIDVAEATLTSLTPGGTVGVSTTPVPLPLPGTYTCSATLPIVLG